MYCFMVVTINTHIHTDTNAKTTASEELFFFFFCSLTIEEQDRVRRGGKKTQRLIKSTRGNFARVLKF